MCNIGVYLRGVNNKKTYLLMDFDDPTSAILEAARRCRDRNAEDCNRRKPKSKKVEKYRNQLE